MVQFLGRPVLYCLPHHALTFYFLQTKMETLVHKFVVITLYCFSWLFFNTLAAIFLRLSCQQLMIAGCVMGFTDCGTQNTSCTNYYFSVQLNPLHKCYIQRSLQLLHAENMKHFTPPEKRPSTHCKGSWVGLRAGGWVWEISTPWHFAHLISLCFHPEPLFVNETNILLFRL